MKHFYSKRSMLSLVATGLTLTLVACSGGKGEKPVEVKEDIKKISIGVQGYEFGPAVNKLILEMNQPISTVDAKNLVVKTADIERKVLTAYLSDEKGNETEKKESTFVTLELEVTYSQETFSGIASPFVFSFETFMNNWAETYPVAVSELTVDGSPVSKEEDAINNRVIPEVDKFAVQKEFAGDYLNPLTKKTEKMTLHYAAFEPETLKKEEKNPLLIWLHGQGEGGTDTAVTLLGNEVTALARDEIQEQFTAGKQTGAYVLAVQTPTYWMDEGDGKNGSGAGVSRYTEILMDTIKEYVASNPDVDTDRIYLSGCSNGGYMTLNMAIQYPDYFAALVPNAPAYAYYQYERNEDGTYKTQKNAETGFEAPIQLDTVWFDQEKVAKIKDIPMWFIHSKDDTTVLPDKYPLPVYKALVDAGAENKWFSYYESVVGVDQPGVGYMGHWSWIYYFNNQALGVQDPKAVAAQSDFSGFAANNKEFGGSQKATVDGKEYDTVFQWLNDQSK